MNTTQEEIISLRACQTTLKRIAQFDREGRALDLNGLDYECWQELLYKDPEAPPTYTVPDTDAFPEWMDDIAARCDAAIAERVRYSELAGIQAVADRCYYTDIEIRAGFNLAYRMGFMDADAPKVNVPKPKAADSGGLNLFEEVTT